MKKIISILIAILLVILGGGVFARKVLYPVKDIAEIKSISKKYDIDPYLLAALGHFESRFEEKEYVKNANNGILRFSDESSIKLAQELKIDNFKPSDLTDNKTSLELGAYYLSKFKNQGLNKMVEEWNVRNGEEVNFDRRDYAKKFYVPRTEQNIKILKVLYPELKM
ncbi:transglycosylase SLT domain-containing protein [Paraclostridium ghonii]|uniref:transglycosylase SLT domain-containing protein n=1 Tax=Paraclostridium ghonii TaxID=29358 RepID=UPI00202CB42F|nr:transglycosylase SLT domain-containing protein [Paeniclostridium ghonii]MCM0165738.1 transglycosylase SLT domain-containing protein [Paeniclostridium ghonii]